MLGGVLLRLVSQGDERSAVDAGRVVLWGASAKHQGGLFRLYYVVSLRQECYCIDVCGGLA